MDDPSSQSSVTKLKPTSIDHNDADNNDNISMDIEPPFKSNLASVEDWRTALNKVVPAVVVLRTTATRSFDTDCASAGHATGFIVDKIRGIILTNRHVVMPGPIVAEATFVNREEIPVYPIYRDPVHDFGFFRYDPGSVKFLNYEEIPLAPEDACVGLEIRVVGNDSGEKVSILAGTIARLDRDAPHYKKDGYNDFNTFYLQAASGTKGGSSGSPVISSEGKAVALNAGGKTTSSSSAFFLPLERVVRALNLLQKGKDLSGSTWNAVAIPRGTLQTTFRHKGFDEIRRLGLRSETEEMIRHATPASETGMLVVNSAVPGGPAHKYLEPGDVLVRVTGQVMTQFLELEILLDDNVDQQIEMQIERGGNSITVSLMVQDLHSITPNYFLEINGAIIHPLSYQQARNFRFKCGLVYVAETGYMLSRAQVPRHAIIKKFAGQEISHVDNFISAISGLPRGARVPLEYITHGDRHRSKSVLVTIERHDWYGPPQIYSRNDSSGLWDRKEALPSPSCVAENATSVNAEASSLEPVPRNIKQKLMEKSIITPTLCDQVHKESYSLNGFVTESKSQSEDEISTLDGPAVPIVTVARQEEQMLRKKEIQENDCLMDAQGEVPTNTSFAERFIEPSLVMFEVNIPISCLLDGVQSKHFSGTGLIIYHSETVGLVAVDKNTVPISVCDVMLSFAAFPMEIPGEVVFLHPVHNYALVAYDSSALGLVGVSVVRAAKLLPEPSLRRGDSVYLVGLNRSQHATSRKSAVTNPCFSLIIGSASSPRYRAMNMEVIELDTDFGSSFSGVLTNENGYVQALWGSFSTQVKYGAGTAQDSQFSRGMAIYSISEVLDKIVSGENLVSDINSLKKSMPLLRVLEVEFYSTLLSKARSYGLSDKWINALVKKDSLRRQVLCVKGCFAGSKAENLLQQGDMILAIKKEPITCFRDLEKACDELDMANGTGGELSMTIFRQGKELDVLVGTDLRDGNGTTHMVNWCGCIVQDPHTSVRSLGFLPDEGHGVYVARSHHGSPANRYGLYALLWIIEINGKIIPDLESFVEVVKGLKHGDFVRVKTIHLNGKPAVMTLKQDLHYWPTWEIKYDSENGAWQRRTIKG